MVLIVDDDEVLAELLVEVLSVHKFTGEFVTNFQDAWRRMQERSGVEILVTDLALEDGVTGTQLCRQTMLAYPATRFVIMSGDLGDADTDGIFPAPALLQKPFGLTDFIERVLAAS